MLGLGLSELVPKLGLSEFVPIAVYGLGFVVAFLALFYRSEIGILFISFFIPIYTVLNKAIQSELPLANQIVDVLLIAMLLGWIFQNKNIEDRRLGFAPLLMPILALMGYSLFSLFIGSSFLGETIFGESFTNRLAYWKNYMIMPVLYLVTYHNLRDRKWKYLLFGLIFVSLLVSDFKFRQTFRWVQHTHFMDESRLGGTLAFLGPNEWGSFHAIYNLFVLGLLLVDRNWRRRIIYLIVILGSTYSLLYSFSRGGYFGFMIGLFFIGLIKSRKLLVVLIVFLLVWKLIVPVSVVERVTGTFIERGEGKDVISVGDTEIETVGRRELWEKALRFFYNNPILGTGFNTYHLMTGRDTHNVYLKTMAEQGLVGLLIYLTLYLCAIWSGWRLYRKADEELVKALGFGFLCCTIGSIVVNFFGDRWTYLQLGGLYWIFWGLVDQERRKIETKKILNDGV
jgi:O-antigen ligase